MNKILTILSLLIILSCTKQETDISGTWLNSDFTSPTILEFTDSQWIDYIFHGDTINYIIKKDSIFILNLSGQNYIGFPFKITGDSLWTTFPGDLQTEETLYIKSKGNNFVDDIKSSLGITLNLPEERSNIVGNRFTISIYYPKQSITEQYKYIYLNNERVNLDTLLHEKIFTLLEPNEYWRFDFIGIYIDTSTKYDQIRLLFDELRKVQFLKIALIGSLKSNKSIYPRNTGIIRKLPPIFNFEDYYINPKIRKSIYKPPPYPNHLRRENLDSNLCRINIMDNKLLMNESKFNINDYLDFILENNPHITILNIDNETNYQTYFSFLQIVDSLVKLKKNHIAQDLYSKDYEMLISEERIKKVNKLSKFGLIEK